MLICVRNLGRMAGVQPQMVLGGRRANDASAVLGWCAYMLY